MINMLCLIMMMAFTLILLSMRGNTKILNKPIVPNNALNLAPDIISNIGEFLDAENLLNASMVNTHWNAALISKYKEKSGDENFNAAQKMIETLNIPKPNGIDITNYTVCCAVNFYGCLYHHNLHPSNVISKNLSSVLGKASDRSPKLINIRKQINQIIGIKLRDGRHEQKYIEKLLTLAFNKCSNRPRRLVISIFAIMRMMEIAYLDAVFDAIEKGNATINGFNIEFCKGMLESVAMSIGYLSQNGVSKAINLQKGIFSVLFSHEGDRRLSLIELARDDVCLFNEINARLTHWVREMVQIIN
eukprot:516787_1